MEERINEELNVIKLAIYYVLATSEEEQITYLEDCITVLNNEIKMMEKGETLFNVEPSEHIINELSKKIINLNNKDYKERIKKAIIKISYYNSVVEGYHLRNIASEKDIDELSNEIIYFNKGLEELEQESKENNYAMYELRNRYYYSKEYSKAYEIYKNISESGHKNSTYMMSVCIYNGEGVEKNEKKAFEILSNLVEKEVHTKAE